MSDLKDHLVDDDVLVATYDLDGRLRAVIRRPGPDAPVAILTITPPDRPSQPFSGETPPTDPASPATAPEVAS